MDSDSVSSKVGVSTCNPQGGWKHGFQANVVTVIKKLDYTGKPAAEVRKSLSERRLHPADFFAVYGEGDTVMKEISTGIVLKKRLCVDVVVPRT